MKRMVRWLSVEKPLPHWCIIALLALCLFCVGYVSFLQYRIQTLELEKAHPVEKIHQPCDERNVVWL